MADEFSEIKEHFDDLKAKHGTRNADFEQYEAAYFMEWGTSKRALKKKVTISPDPRNAIRGAIQLVVATDPQFNLHQYKGQEQKKLEQLEKAMDRAWVAAGKIAKVPVHYDMIESAMLYSEIHTAVTLTADLVAAASKNKVDKGAKERAEYLAAQTPFVFKSINPRTGYPEFDDLGQLVAYGREYEVTGAMLQAKFGVGNEQYSRYKNYTLCEFWDYVNYCAWVGGEALVLAPHELPAVPISVTLTEGSRLFDKPERQREPLLYAVVKGGWWSWQNAILTTVFTSVFAMGLSPAFIHVSPTTGKKDLDIDFDQLPAVAELEQGEQLTVIQNKGVIDPSVSEALGLISQTMEQSTIYKQALGAPLAGQQPYSSLALLSQSGRLPLVNTQKRGAWAIGDVVELALRMVKKGSAKYAANGIELVPGDIPDAVCTDVKLDVKLPQDKLQLASIAHTIKGDGLADDEWIQTEILGINQPAEMQNRVRTQQATQAMFGAMVQQLVQQTLMQQQQQQLQGQGQQFGGGMAGQGGMPGGQGGGMGPVAGEGGEDLSLAAGPTPAGAPTVEGLPQAQAGMLPGQGQAAAPEGMV